MTTRNEGITYRSHIVYKVMNANTVLRYTVVEDLSGRGFFVLHADFLRENKHADHAFLSKVTIEQLLALDVEETAWEPPLADAVQSHDDAFEN